MIFQKRILESIIYILEYNIFHAFQKSYFKNLIIFKKCISKCI